MVPSIPFRDLFRPHLRWLRLRSATVYGAARGLSGAARGLSGAARGLSGAPRGLSGAEVPGEDKNTMKAYMYILECSDGSYYTGSTKNLELRLAQHQAGEGSNHTRKRLPVKLIYFEEYQRIDAAFYGEKQVQGWSRKKKEALINGLTDELKKLAECMNESHCRFFGSNQDPPFNTEGSAELKN